MRLDLVSIFPEFFDVLDLSLIGRAQQNGLLEVRRHDLRGFTEDRHRTVDSPPAGGGAGMVMKPEPWAQALEHVLEHVADDAAAVQGAEPQRLAGPPTLIVPSPSGEVFTQGKAEELAQREHLVFAPGRFEGIDERFMDWAAGRFELRRMSIGDYVLNGGEAAVVVMVEAVTRLLPGVIGNAESLAEESHSGEGLLEYPLYTKPAQWRDHEIPPVLLSGDHGRIEEWRREQSRLRTRKIRPDLWARWRVARERDTE